jgi:ABC-2 type transport system permease protein
MAILRYFLSFNLTTNSGVNHQRRVVLNSMQTWIMISRISPIQLFNESMALVLLPGARTLSQYLMIASTDVQYYLLDTPLSVGQSLLIVWPQIMITVLLTIICFAIAYIKFMREEIRST